MSTETIRILKMTLTLKVSLFVSHCLMKLIFSIDPEPDYETLPIISPSDFGLAGYQRRQLIYSVYFLTKHFTDPHCRVVVYGVSRKMPMQARYCISDIDAFDFSDYTLPENWGKASYQFFSVHSMHYEPANQIISLRGRGNILVVINRNVHRVDCPHLCQWERSAVMCARMDGKYQRCCN